MNRRRFLASLFKAGAAAAVGPALLALVPAQRPAGPIDFSYSSIEVIPTSEILDGYLAPAVAALQQQIDADLARYMYGSLA